MIEFYFRVSIVAITSVLFNQVLNQPKEIFAWKPSLIHTIASLGKANPLVKWEKNWLQLALIKILDDCPKCLAFWLAIPTYLHLYRWDFFHCLAFAVSSVFAAFLITKFVEKI